MNAFETQDFATVRWLGDEDGRLGLLDQTRLPGELRYLSCSDVETVFEAIQTLRVRGAPAIGVAAAYGVVVGLQTAVDLNDADFDFRLDEIVRRLGESRPTAVNLFWALDRMRTVARKARGTLSNADIRRLLLEEAHSIFHEDRAMCAAIGEHGAALINDGDGILTHCNAGALATAGDGTALAVVYAAADRGKRFRMFVDETRPLLQGARLTAWELMRRELDVTLLCDNAAPQLMAGGQVQLVLVGADRIAANGDTANKIGTYGVALAAAAHNVPFYVAAPSSTFDLAIAAGDAIPIEQRDPREVTHGFGRATAPEGILVYNPAFDVTPARLITGIVCEFGMIRPVNAETIRRVLTGGAGAGG
jgi:methylthioribose-1-phosphate isomerase